MNIFCLRLLRRVGKSRGKDRVRDRDTGRDRDRGRDKDKGGKF